MPKHCSAYGCSNRWRQNCKLSFHRFPKNLERRELWIQAVARQGWIPTDNSWLCGGHFISGKAAQDWDTKNPDWVPSVFNFNTKMIDSSMSSDVFTKDQPNEDTSIKPQSLFIQLPDIAIGKANNLRYLRICCPSLDVVSAQKMDGLSKDSDSLYLFLGSDVLHGSSVNTVHHPRTHARFAKRGFACKLHFSKYVKLNGVHGTSHGIWFYTIQGVFRVLFELHDRSTQFHCMKQLQALWLASYTDRIVPESSRVLFEVETTSNAAKGDSLNRFIDEEHTYSKRTPGYDATGIHTGASKHIQQVVKGHISGLDCQYNEQKIENDDYDDQIWKDVDPNSVGNMGRLDENTRRHKLDYYSGKSSSGIQELLENITKQIDQLGDNIVSGLPKYPLELLAECLHYAKTSKLSEQVVSRDAMFEFMLNSISGWLGTEFHQIIPNVLQKADEFKTRHIDSIDNLPSAGEVVTEIFHSAMETLLVSWMGIIPNHTRASYTDPKQKNINSSNNSKSVTQDEMCSSTTTEPNVDRFNLAMPSKHLNRCSVKKSRLHLSHDSSGKQCQSSFENMTDSEDERVNKKRKQDSLNLYPLIQLILELANQTLISGMAHVLFPRLVQQGA